MIGYYHKSIMRLIVEKDGEFRSAPLTLQPVVWEDCTPMPGVRFQRAALTPVPHYVARFYGVCGHDHKKTIGYTEYLRQRDAGIDPEDMRFSRRAMQEPILANQD